MATAHTPQSRAATGHSCSAYGTQRWSAWSQSTDSLVSAIVRFPDTPQGSMSTLNIHKEQQGSESSSNASQETLVPHCPSAGRATFSPRIRCDHPTPPAAAAAPATPAQATAAASRTSILRDEHLRALTYEFETHLLQFRLLAAPLLQQLAQHMEGSESKLDELLLCSIRRVSAQATEAMVMVTWYRETKLRCPVAGSLPMQAPTETEEQEKGARRNAFEASNGERTWAAAGVRQERRPHTAGGTVHTRAPLHFGRSTSPSQPSPSHCRLTADVPVRSGRGSGDSTRASTRVLDAAAVRFPRGSPSAPLRKHDTLARQRTNSLKDLTLSLRSPAATTTRAGSLALAPHTRPLSLAYTASAAAHSTQTAPRKNFMPPTRTSSEAQASERRPGPTFRALFKPFSS
ncbi:hypothetical protein EX895_002206 [Sporisorium graminicola]|uniref:Uncharacterized protein n=1 Tax=Sporisorium graminicola TaxID=280036 RepID=A0A4U7KW60_9BASI|nr:hypothetical protein EX895_002206 [Sporisorium graminicola]TKY88965.1 hypothetical protein EX895_002206 [Sporisorium graminicola]